MASVRMEPGAVPRPEAAASCRPFRRLEPWSTAAPRPRPPRAPGQSTGFRPRHGAHAGACLVHGGSRVCQPSVFPHPPSFTWFASRESPRPVSKHQQGPDGAHGVLIPANPGSQSLLQSLVRFSSGPACFPMHVRVRVCACGRVCTCVVYVDTHPPGV